MSDNKFDLNTLANHDFTKYLKDSVIASRQMQNINIPQTDYSNLTFPAQEHREEEKMYWEESLNLLKLIESNTANLAMLVDLISKNNENQDEIIGILSEVLEIAKAKNKEEADNLYRKIMKKATTFTKDVEAIQKLTVFAGTVYKLVLNNIDKIEHAGKIVKEVADNIV